MLIGWGVEGDERLGRAEGALHVDRTDRSSARGLILLKYGPDAGIDERRRQAIFAAWKAICPSSVLEEADAEGNIVPFELTRHGPACD